MPAQYRDIWLTRQLAPDFKNIADYRKDPADAGRDGAIVETYSDSMISAVQTSRCRCRPAASDSRLLVQAETVVRSEFPSRVANRN